MRKKLPIGRQTFEHFTTENLVYVDKTALVFEMIDEAKYYFLSRPRRFGKSTLVSTFKSLFEGRKDLFKGLWIEEKIEWKKYPIIHISFSTIGIDELSLEQAIFNTLNKIASENGIILANEAISQDFEKLIHKLYAQYGQVVILIDEYDYPINQALERSDFDLAEERRRTLRSFYSIIKDADYYIKFLFMTGISRFSKLSLFSVLNNLSDITINEKYSALLGYTENELRTYFSGEIEALALKLGLSLEKTYAELKKWYNGYNWMGENVYNPFSILSVLLAKDIKEYWFSSGTPAFLIALMKEKRLFKIENIVLSSENLDIHDFRNLDVLGLMFQTGYLTISGQPAEDTYEMQYPNNEVKRAFSRFLLSSYSENVSIPNPLLFVNALKKNDLEDFFDKVNILFANIPYQIFLAQYEAYYHSILYLLFSLMGFHTECEFSVAKGRGDVAIHTSDRIFVMEFKLGKSGQYALNQINRAEYTAKFAHLGKEIVLVGVPFSKEKKAVGNWKKQVLK